MWVVSPRSANAIARGRPTCPQPPTTATSDVKPNTSPNQLAGGMLDGLRNAGEASRADLPRCSIAPRDCRVVAPDPSLDVLDTAIGIVRVRVCDVRDGRSDDVDRRDRGDFVARTNRRDHGRAFRHLRAQVVDQPRGE